jgi:hypothetical protein
MWSAGSLIFEYQVSDPVHEGVMGWKSYRNLVIILSQRTQTTQDRAALEAIDMISCNISLR